MSAAEAPAEAPDVPAFPLRIVGDPSLGGDGLRVAVDADCPHCGWAGTVVRHALPPVRVHQVPVHVRREGCVMGLEDDLRQAVYDAFEIPEELRQYDGPRPGFVDARSTKGVPCITTLEVQK